MKTGRARSLQKPDPVVGVERSGHATVDHGYSNILLTLDDKTR